MTESMGVVTYYDFGLSHAETPTQALRAWAARVRAETGVIETMLFGEIGRPERFALVETWADHETLKVHRASGAREEGSIATGMVAPPDERIGEPFTIETARPAGPQAVYVLIHVDVATFELGAVGDWLRAVSEAARSAPGASRYEVWRQVGRPNHFTVIQAWADRDAYARHIEDAATRAFRDKVMSVKGALYDERLYHLLD